MSEEQEVNEAPNTHEFNKELQQVQQEKANFQRRSQDLEAENASLLEQLRAVPEVVETPEDNGSIDAYEQVEQSKKDIEDLRQKLAKNEILLNNQDLTIKNINQKSDYEKQLKAFDGVYGPDNRNAAIQRATQKCIDAGYTLEGSDHPPYKDMINVVKESYIHEYYQNKDKKVAEKPKGDNGLGGSSFVDLGDGIPEGSPEEVLLAMQKARSG